MNTCIDQHRKKIQIVLYLRNIYMKRRHVYMMITKRALMFSIVNLSETEARFVYETRDA